MPAQEKSLQDRYLKVVLIGDEHCGKIQLLHQYTQLPLPIGYVPTVWTQFSSDVCFETNTHKITTLLPPVATEHDEMRELKCNGDRHLQALWNTPDSSDASDLYSIAVREHCCYQASCIILLYSIQSIASFGRMQYQFYEEIRHDTNMRNLPLLVVGTHSEFRDCSTVEERQRLAQQLQENLHDVSGEPIHEIDEFADLNNLVPYEDAAAWAKAIGAKQYIECSHQQRKNVTQVFHTALNIALDWQLAQGNHEPRYIVPHSGVAPPPISAAAAHDLNTAKISDVELQLLYSQVAQSSNDHLPSKRPANLATSPPHNGLQPPGALAQQQQQPNGAAPVSQQPAANTYNNRPAVNGMLSNTPAYRPQAAGGLGGGFSTIPVNQSIVPTATTTPRYKNVDSSAISGGKSYHQPDWKHDSKRFNPDGSAKQICCSIQ